MSWRDAPLVSQTPAWQSAPLSSNPELPLGSGISLDQATIDRLRRTNPTLLAELEKDYSAQAIARGTSTGQAVRIGAGKSLSDFATGIKQLALGAGEAMGIVEPGRKADYTQQVQSDLRAYQTLADEKPIAAGAGELIGDVAATAGIPLGGATMLATRAGPRGLRTLSTLRNLGAAAGVNAGIAGAEFTAEGDSRATNMAQAAGLGVAGHAAMNIIGKGINAVRGRMRNAREQAVFDEAKAAGVQLTAGDLTQNPFLQTIDSMMERVMGIGLQGVRRRQAEAATQKLDKLRDDYVKYVFGDGPVGAAADEVKGSLFRGLNQAKANVARLYDDVERIAGDAPVLTNNLSGAAEVLLHRESRDIPNEAMQSSGLRQLLEPYTDVTALTFAGARKLRSRLKADIRAAQRNAVVGGEDIALANRLVDGIEADIADFGRQQGGMLSTRLSQADRAYRAQVVPYKDKLLAGTMNDQNFDINLEGWISNPARMRTVFNAADNKGKQALRLAMIDKVLDFSRVGVEGQEYISPERFTQQMRKLKGSFGYVFDQQSNKQIEGINRLMQHIRGVDRANRTEATGMGAAKQAMTLASMGAIGGAATGAIDLASFGAGTASLGALRLALGSNIGARTISAAADMRDKRGLDAIWNSVRRIAERNASILDGTVRPDDDDE